MRLEVSDSHHHRLAAVSTLHVLVPRDELEYAMCQVYSMRVGKEVFNNSKYRRDPIASRPQFIGPLPHPDLSRSW